ncbi:response regulator, partial [bacterium]|nr:response regulator [bacterium]
MPAAQADLQNQQSPVTEKADAISILVADDEEGIRFVLEELLRRQGYEVLLAETGEKALEHLRARTFELAILDINLPGVNGIDILRQARQWHPDLICLMITGHDCPDYALEALREGAYDFFTKPFDVHEMRVTVQRAIEKKHL